jgi:sulfate transport system substrate-binding protein
MAAAAAGPLSEIDPTKASLNPSYSSAFRWCASASTACENELEHLVSAIKIHLAIAAAMVATIATVLIAAFDKAQASEVTLLNASFDSTREMYEAVNAAFARQIKSQSRIDLVVDMSHGGSGKQARAVIEGLEADVVTLAVAGDIDMISEKGGLLPSNWQSRLPDNSCPYTSTVVFLVRAGNPKKIRDWSDLAKPSITVVTPNPKTSGGARWNFLAAWGYALKRNDGNESKATEFVKAVYRNVPVLDSGARGATTTFVEREIGDVLIGWESEALIAQEQIGAGKFEVIYPTISILAEPPVAWVDKVDSLHGTGSIAKSYLEFLYKPEVQMIIADHFFRPRDQSVMARYQSRFPALESISIDRDFGGWKKAQAKFFADGGVFDRIYQPGN